MKSFDFVDPDDDFKINRNMRCIEMAMLGQAKFSAAKINRNMRCIEIKITPRYDHQQMPINRNMRCIEIE